MGQAQHVEWTGDSGVTQKRLSLHMPATDPEFKRGLIVKDTESISFKELFERYQVLLTENSNLKEEIGALKARLDAPDAQVSTKEIFRKEPEPGNIAPQSTLEALPSGISNGSDSAAKIRLFISLFKGREDVYARRWQSKQKETSGYLQGSGDAHADLW